MDEFAELRALLVYENKNLAGVVRQVLAALGENGAMFSGRMLWYVLACFLVNFVIIYRGVTKGIERFCNVAMPLLIRGEAVGDALGAEDQAARLAAEVQ